MTIMKSLIFLGFFGLIHAMEHTKVLPQANDTYQRIIFLTDFPGFLKSLEEIVGAVKASGYDAIALLTTQIQDMKDLSGGLLIPIILLNQRLHDEGPFLRMAGSVLKISQTSPMICVAQKKTAIFDFNYFDQTLGIIRPEKIPANSSTLIWASRPALLWEFGATGIIADAEAISNFLEKAKLWSKLLHKRKLLSIQEIAGQQAEVQAQRVLPQPAAAHPVVTQSMQQESSWLLDNPVTRFVSRLLDDSLEKED